LSLKDADFGNDWDDYRDVDRCEMKFTFLNRKTAADFADERG